MTVGHRHNRPLIVVLGHIIINPVLATKRLFTDLMVLRGVFLQLG